MIELQTTVIPWTQLDYKNLMGTALPRGNHRDVLILRQVGVGRAPPPVVLEYINTDWHLRSGGTQIRKRYWSELRVQPQTTHYEYLYIPNAY